MSHSTMPRKYGKSARREKKILVNQQDLASFPGFLNKTIQFQLVPLGYEVILSIILHSTRAHEIIVKILDPEECSER